MLTVRVITEAEINLRDALDIFSATNIGDGVILGIGGTAIVYEVIVHHHHFALKIVKGTERLHVFENEISFLRWQKCIGNLGKISQLEACTYLPSGALAALLSPVGLPIPNDNLAGLFPEICCVFAELHRCGWRHGDARMPNLIIHNTDVVLIDFGYVKYCHTADELCSEAMYDMYKIIASFLGLENTCDLDQDPQDLIQVQTGFYNQIDEAVLLYIANGYTNDAAIELAHSITRL